jgi:hypothetical protein
MKKALFATAVLFASSAHAEWTRIDAPFKDVALYVDHSTAQKGAGRRVQLYHIIDYHSPQQRDGREFRSEMIRYEFDCDKDMLHDIVHTWHKGQMGIDKMVLFSEGSWYWNKPEAGSIEEVLLKATCSLY